MKTIDNANYRIERKVEFGDMARLFMGKGGQTCFIIITSVLFCLFFCNIQIYLLGDLAIYGVTIPDSLAKMSPDGIDILNMSLTQNELYNIYVIIFGILMIPISCFNFQKTKYLQLITTATRQLALLSLIFYSSTNLKDDYYCYGIYISYR